MMLNRIRIDNLMDLSGIINYADLAEQLRVDPSQLSRWLAGRQSPNLKSLGNFVALFSRLTYLKIDIDYLIGDDKK